MKTLYIVRHAKSSWDERGIPDHDRKLNARGLRDAPKMGEVLANKGYHPDIIYSSSANRALITAKIIAEKIGYPLDKIIVTRDIYDAITQDLVSLINRIDDEYKSAMMFGHNPGFTVLANILADKYIDNMPTCAVAVIELNVDSWKNVESDCGKLIAFEYPKKHS
ncbi:Phosphoglycerate/bisphosphoglycerate mutase [hydrothermal vent metagenome]|uniref:Phosphoglycerate/bisphosphoglycerate mutase n=1 Tax=hydrothermal vent metagenome TaxID=652676 RepID=A0A3B1CDQ8_9ZZZZ